MKYRLIKKYHPAHCSDVYVAESILTPWERFCNLFPQRHVRHLSPFFLSPEQVKNYMAETYKDGKKVDFSDELIGTFKID